MFTPLFVKNIHQSSCPITKYDNLGKNLGQVENGSEKNSDIQSI